MNFELIMAGFDGGTDETDDLILWVDTPYERPHEVRHYLIEQGLMLPWDADGVGVIAAVHPAPQSIRTDIALDTLCEMLKPHLAVGTAWGAPHVF